MILMESRNESDMNIQHVLERGYVVGFFDADGCVTNGKYTRVFFNNTNYQALEKVKTILRRELGIVTDIHTQEPRNKEWKEMYSIQINSRTFTEPLMKFLLDNGAIVKRKALKMALNRTIILKQESQRPAARYWTPEEDYAVRTCWKKFNDSEIGDMIQRSAGAVRVRRQTLGLKKLVMGRPKKGVMASAEG